MRSVRQMGRRMTLIHNGCELILMMHLLYIYNMYCILCGHLCGEMRPFQHSHYTLRAELKAVTRSFCVSSARKRTTTDTHTHLTSCTHHSYEYMKDSHLQANTFEVTLKVLDTSRFLHCLHLSSSDLICL